MEKLSGVTLGLGKGVFGVSLDIDTADTFFIASGKSSGKLAGCVDEVAANRFSDMIFNIFLPASLV